jgi:hypothetical protein
MRIRNLMIASGLLAHGLLLTSNAAGAQQCTGRTTVGRYLVVCDGFLSPAPNSPLVPAKELATVVSDSSGTFTSTDGILTLGGIILHGTAIGTGVTKPDCTGTITYQQTINGQAAPDLHIAYVISKNGDAIDGIDTDPGAVFSCHLTRTANE